MSKPATTTELLDLADEVQRLAANASVYARRAAEGDGDKVEELLAAKARLENAVRLVDDALAGEGR